MKNVAAPITHAILLTLLTLPALADSSTHWNEFRGPNGSGVALNSTPPIQLDSSNPTWSIPLPPGASSPVIFGDTLVITAYENETLATLALNKNTGELIWKKYAPKRPAEKVHESRGQIASTPYIDAKRIYIYHAPFGLIAYDHKGAELWQKSIPTPKTKYGMATSLIAFEQSIILTLDNEENIPKSKLRKSKIIAVDRATGKQLWEQPRGFFRSSWSTPTLYQNNGSTEIITIASGAAAAYDARTGEYKWHIGGFSPEAVHRPFVGDGTLYLSGSMLGGVSDAQPDPEPFWQAILRFDANNDQIFQREEITELFTYPLRPDLPTEHSGFGIPLPSDPAKRKEKQLGHFSRFDTNNDGQIHKKEFIDANSFKRGSKPNLMAIQPGGKGDITNTHIQWAIHSNIPETPNPIYHNKIIYMIRDGGIITAVNASNGKTIYRKRLPNASGHYRPSPVIANNHLYILSQEGVLSVIKTGEDFELAHQHDFDDRVEATPAFDESTIYIRTQSKLYAFKAD